MEEWEAAALGSFTCATKWSRGQLAQGSSWPSRLASTALITWFRRTFHYHFQLRGRFHGADFTRALGDFTELSRNQNYFATIASILTTSSSLTHSVRFTHRCSHVTGPTRHGGQCFYVSGCDTHTARTALFPDKNTENSNWLMWNVAERDKG